MLGTVFNVVCDEIFLQSFHVAVNVFLIQSAAIMAVRCFSTSSQSFLKFYIIFCVMFVILNGKGLLMLSRNDFAPSDTRGTLTDWIGANYSTKICNLAGRHLGLFSCR